MSRYIFQGVFQDQSGNVVASGSVSVVLAGTSTVAIIYESESGGSAVSGGVVTTNSAGKFVFYVDDSDYSGDQKYDLTFSQTNFTPQTYEDILVEFPTNILTDPQINDTSRDHQYVFAVNELSADRTVTLPLLTGNDEFVFKDHIVTMTNKTLTTPTLTTPLIDDGDAGLTITSADQTDAAPTATIPDITGAADEFVMNDTAQNMTNKTLTSPKIDDGDADVTITSADQTNAAATVTIPNIGDAADEFVMKDTTQTLTLKTLTNPTMTTPTLGSAAATSITLSGAGTSVPDANTLYKDNIIKAWIHFNGTTVTGDSDLVGVGDSFNISALVDAGTGVYIVTFDRDFSNTDYCGLASSNSNQTVVTAYETTHMNLRCNDSAGAVNDVTEVCAQATGDQA